MAPTTNHQLLLGSAVVSVVSLIVAISAMWYAVSVGSEPAQELQEANTVSGPVELTEENPASQLPHYDRVVPIRGEVVATSGSSLQLRSNNGEIDIQVNAATKIYAQGSRKDEAAYEEEMAAFREAMRSTNGIQEVFIAPSPFEKQEIALADIHAGDVVHVISAGIEDLRAMAHEIVVLREIR